MSALRHSMKHTEFDEHLGVRVQTKVIDQVS